MAYGNGVADTVYGKAYSEYGGKTVTKDYPVSTKYRCEDCSNEFTKPELLEAQSARERSIYIENYKKVEDAIRKILATPQSPKKIVKHYHIGMAKVMSGDITDTLNG